MQIQILYTFGVLLLVLTVTEAANYLTEQPDVLVPCSLDDPGFSTCLAKNLQVLVTTWKDGLPGTNIVGPWDPLAIKRVKLSQTGNSAVSINADLRNILVRGASQGTVKEARYNSKEYKLKALLYIPKLSYDFDYKMRGNLLVLNLNSQGKGHFECDKLTAVLELEVKPRITPQANFADVQNVKVYFPEIGNFKIKLNNLFGGDKQLEDTAHMIINENWRQFYDIMRPGIEQAIQAIALDRFKKILSYLPANYLIKNFH